MIRRLAMAALVGLCPEAGWAAPVCLQSFRIDHTEIPDDGAILFHMIDRSVYRAVMQGGCPGLRMDTRGFTYEPTPGSNEICANLFTIRLNTTGSVCLVGAIEMITPPRH